MPFRLHAFTIERTVIDTTEDEWYNAQKAGRIDHKYDHVLSDMDGETVVVLPDGQVVNPYSGDEYVNLLELLRPILKYVPTRYIDQYAAARRSEEK